VFDLHPKTEKAPPRFEAFHLVSLQSEPLTEWPKDHPKLYAITTDL